MNDFNAPLSEDEFVELGELLASIPSPYEPMEADRMDGYLTAILLLPQEPAPATWMPYIFDAEGNTHAQIPNEDKQTRLEELIYRRYRDIDKTLAACEAIDPIIYEIENDRGRPVGGWDGIAAIQPFAEGFLEVINRWPGLKDHENELISSALLGILRHLPDELAGDIAEIKEELELDSPLENLNQAIEDVAISCAEIASITRGFVPKAEKAARPQQRSRQKHPFRQNRNY